MVSVKLRAMEPEDLDLLYRIENDAQLWDVGTTNVPYSRYTLHDYIASASGDIYTDRQLRLIVEDEAGNTLGIADLADFDPRHRRAEVGIVIEQPYRQKGFALAALSELHRYARRVLLLHQLYAVISAGNQAALNLFRKAGYQSIATLPQWLCTENGYSDAVCMQLVLQ